MATPFDKGPPPDLSARFKLKAKYASLQRKYARALETRKDLTIEVQEKAVKVSRLEDEVTLVIDQIYDTDYVHLAPRTDDLFSDEDEGEAEGSRQRNGRRQHQARQGGTAGAEDVDSENESDGNEGEGLEGEQVKDQEGDLPRLNGGAQVRKERTHDDLVGSDPPSPGGPKAKRARLDGQSPALGASV